MELMDPKRDFRDLKKYLSRRGLGGDNKTKVWLASNAILTLEQLESFCLPRELKFSEAQFAHFFSAPPVTADVPVEKTRKAPPKSKSKDDSASESWHVPAAKRPLKKAPAPSRSRRKKKKSE